MESYTAMPDTFDQWPRYADPQEALRAETSNWGDRLALAQDRYAQLGELPASVRTLGVVMIDGASELPETFSLLDMYDRQPVDRGSLGALLYVNYEGITPSRHTKELVMAVRARQAQARVPTVMSVVGYEGQRKMDSMTSDAWDIAVAHALARGVRHRIVGLSNDFDTTHLPLDYMPKMTNNPYVDRPASVWGTPITFREVGKLNSPMNKLLRYLNAGKTLYGELQGAPALYGASMACTLDTYAIAHSWTHAQSGPDPYGNGRSINLVLNVWERATGQEGSVYDFMPAVQDCFNWVGTYLETSPRREIYAFSRDLGNPMSMGRVLTTDADNPVLRMTPEQMARMADSVSADNPQFKQHLDALDSLWLNSLPEESNAGARDILRRARHQLGLPAPAFDE
jgi:hypothetical protein